MPALLFDRLEERHVPDRCTGFFSVFCLADLFAAGEVDHAQAARALERVLRLRVHVDDAHLVHAISYGLHSCGIYSHGLHSYGLHSYGLYSHAFIVMAYIVMAYIVVVHIFMVVVVR